MSAALRNSWRPRSWAILVASLSLAASVSFVRFGLRASEPESGWSRLLSNRNSADPTRQRPKIISAKGQFLAADPTGKFLMDTITNKPVFITGDAPQQLVTELCASDVDTYLKDRQQRGFNALWVYVVDNADQSNPPRNCNGDIPFNGADFTNFNPSYWKFVDSAIANAQRRGIIVFIEPGFVGLVAASGYLTSYQNASPETMTAYGTFLGNRYKGFSNVAWALGGDADPAQAAAYKNLASLAAAIQAADPNHLITFEACRSGCSSGGNKSSLDAWTGPPAWLGINWVYNNQATVIEGCRAAWNNGNRVLPSIMGEDWYELDHSMTSSQIRQEGYWEILSGCYAGRIFGNAALFAFNSPNSGVTSPTWQSQLGSVGSIGQANMGKLFRSREHWKLAPDTNHTTLTAGYDSHTFFGSAKESLRSFVYKQPARPGTMDSVAARTSDGQTIIAYVPNGTATTVTVDMSKITDPVSLARCWWFNPRDGSTILIGSFATNSTRNFSPPDKSDWVLVIDSERASLAAPGSRDL